MAASDSTSHSKPPSLLKRLAEFLRGENHAIRESLEEVIEESERENRSLSPQERVMLANILRFGEMRVEDVMVPRADIVAIEEKTPLSGLVALLREAQHSRLPLYRETLDDPLGFIHIKDVLTLAEVDVQGGLRWPGGVSIASLKRDILFVPPSMPARDLLLKMQTTHTHLALVIDEHGGTDGLVSIEDLVEEIVGQIADEHDTDDAPKLMPRADGGYDADARLDLADFKERTGVDLAIDGAEDVDTLGGLAVSLTGRVPQRGEIVPHPAGWEFEILEADPRRVRRVRLRRAAADKA
ncbi:MAG: hemolysin family protein [Rhizomicrobium sp.]